MPRTVSFTPEEWRSLIRVPRLVAEAMLDRLIEDTFDQATFEADVASILSTAHRRSTRSALVSAAAKDASDDLRSEWDVYLSRWPNQRQAAIEACREAAQVLAAKVSSAERMAYVRWVLTIAAMLRKVIEESAAATRRADADAQGLIDELARVLLSVGPRGRLRWAISVLRGG